MKQLSTLIITCLFSFSLLGQASQDSEQLDLLPIDKPNEIKVNLLYALWGYTELNYELLFSNRTSLGVTIGTTLFDRDRDFFNFTFSPHHRIYFGKKNCTGFFVESHLAYIGYKDYNFSRDTSEAESAVGLGFAVGAKYVRDTGLSAEVFAGLGRTLSDSDNYFGDVPYPRFGIQFGQRF